MAQTNMKFQKFTNEELLFLKAFHNRVAQMKESRIIKENSLGYHISLNFNCTKGFNLERTFPDEDDFRSFLLIIRPFTLNNDPIFYHRILSIIRKKILEEKCLICLNECEGRFKEHIRNRGMVLRINNISKIGENTKIDKNEYQMENIFKLLLNGYYAHMDILKIKELESFKDDNFMNAGEAIAKTMFIDMLIEYFSYFNFLDNYIISNIISDKKDA